MREERTLTTPPPLTPAEVALARSRLYALAGRLFRSGLTADLLPALAALPGMAERLPARYERDEAAAAHYRLFGMEIPPHESLFLDPSGLLGGPRAEAVAAFHARIGFQPAATAPGPDTLSEELGALAFLTGAEADAWEDGQESTARRMAALQRELLTGHLLPWLFPLALAVEDEEPAFFGPLAGMVVILSSEQMIDADGEAAGDRAFVLPEPPQLDADPAGGLAEIAAYLTTPPLCGIFLSRAAIGRVARGLRLPRGFGSKAQTLETLLRSAAQYDQFLAATAALHALFDGWHRRYARAIETHPHLKPFIRPWQMQTGPARHLLAVLGASGG